MKEKTIAACILLSIIGLLVIITVTQWFLFDYGDNNFQAAIESAIVAAADDDWENAENQAKKADDIWNNGNFIVAVKYAETDYIFLNVYLTRFQTAIKQKDADEVAKEGYASLYIFNNITSIVPQP